MGAVNLPSIDWTLQRPTPAPGNKLTQFVADNNLTQHVHETTRHNNMLDLVISTEEDLIKNLKFRDNIEVYIKQLNLQKNTENGNIASKKY